MKPEDGPLLFLGAGGMGMAPLAAWMAGIGYPITGYDDHLREPVRRYLTGVGVDLPDFLLAEDLPGFAAVVYSSALGTGHPLLEAARARDLPCLRRGEMLARVAAGKRLLAVAGSHGKTSTTGLLVHLLERRGVAINHLVGGFFADPERAPHRVADSDWLVAEIDESDGTIELFSPEVLLLLNTDWDHADRYPDEAAALEAFAGLAGRTSGTVLLPEGLAVAETIRRRTGAEVRSFGPPREGPGGWNGCAALAAASHFPGVGGDPSGLEGFTGMKRREQVLAEAGGLVVVEDYAHHPTEIRMVLGRMAERFPGRRVEVVFQPHRYTRTHQFKEAFGEALAVADRLWLLPVYGAFEEPLAGGRSEDLRDCFDGSAPGLLSLSWEGVKRLLADAGTGPRVLAFLGAGDIDAFARLYTAALVAGENTGEAWLTYLEGQVSPGCKVRLDEPLAAKTTLRVGGAARYYAEPSNLCDLRTLLRSARLFGLPVFCLGRGSNLLVADEGYDGLVVRFASGTWRETRMLPGGRIWAAAGVRLKALCGQAAAAGLGGFEFLEGIPGAVGGALRMNAGAMGGWIFDLVERVHFLDGDGRLSDLPRSAFHFGYRKVEEVSRGIALGAVLRSPGRQADKTIRGRMDGYSSTRKASQPREPSAGCIFKNPEGDAAGRLIDAAGAKGLRVGDAEVSTIHANFIVNRGAATADDVLRLIREVRVRVAGSSGVLLEPEVLLVGAEWDDVLHVEAEAPGRGGRKHG